MQLREPEETPIIKNLKLYLQELEQEIKLIKFWYGISGMKTIQFIKLGILETNMTSQPGVGSVQKLVKQYLAPSSIRISLSTMVPSNCLRGVTEKGI